MVEVEIDWNVLVLCCASPCSDVMRIDILLHAYGGGSDGMGWDELGLGLWERSRSITLFNFLSVYKRNILETFRFLLLSRSRGWSDTVSALDLVHSRIFERVELSSDITLIGQGEAMAIVIVVEEHVASAVGRRY
jgi:hypothetical protein